MSTYTGTWNFYNSFKEYIGDGSIDLDDDVFKVMLVKSTYTPDADNHSVLADITGEIAATGGYARNSLTGITWTRLAAVLTWDANDSIWSANGADFEAARYWVLYDDTTPTKILVAYGLINNAPADVIVSDGTDFTLRWDALGLFTLT
jgi:hypothetical protein